jgi:hypothetical protein
MQTWHTALGAWIFAISLIGAAPSQAQQATIGTPFHTLRDSFFESSGISWSGNYRGITFSYGGAALAVPPFGSPQSTAGLSTNFAIAGKNGQINFGFNFGQGNTQTLTSQTPSVTIMNGQTGYVSDSSLSPFVLGAVPVVGAFVAPQSLPQIPGIDPNALEPREQAMLQAHADARDQAGGPIPPQLQQNANNSTPQRNKRIGAPDPVSAPPGRAEAAQQRLNAAQESSAGRPALSVAEAKRLHQQEQVAASGEMAALMERARALEEDGKPNVAKVYYQRIVKQATGDLQQQAQARLYALQNP